MNCIHFFKLICVCQNKKKMILKNYKKEKRKKKRKTKPT